MTVGQTTRVRSPGHASGLRGRAGVDAPGNGAPRHGRAWRALPRGARCACMAGSARIGRLAPEEPHRHPGGGTRCGGRQFRPRSRPARDPAGPSGGRPTRSGSGRGGRSARPPRRRGVRRARRWPRWPRRHVHNARSAAAHTTAWDGPPGPSGEASAVCGNPGRGATRLCNSFVIHALMAAEWWSSVRILAIASER